jgi:hypothetical protein
MNGREMRMLEEDAARSGGFHVIIKLQDQTTSLIDTPKDNYGSGTHNGRETAV